MAVYRSRLFTAQGCLSSSTAHGCLSSSTAHGCLPLKAVYLQVPLKAVYLQVTLKAVYRSRLFTAQGCNYACSWNLTAIIAALNRSGRLVD